MNDRFNKEAILFVKRVLGRYLENQLSGICMGGFVENVSRIRIKDSTKFNIPDQMSTLYKGAGGSPNTSNAGVCIQYEYDINSGKIIDLEITSAVVSDVLNAKDRQNNIESNDLIIRDLGYYNTELLKSIDKRQAYFISRLNATTSIYDIDTGQKICFKSLYQEMKKNKVSRLDKEVLVSSKKIKFRIVIDIIPEQEYEKRIRRIHKKNKESGYKTSDDIKARARFGLFVTNLAPKDFDDNKVLLLYKIRWQIELMFKNWKSQCGLNKIRAFKCERYVCILYARLILTVIKAQLYFGYKKLFYLKKKRILSSEKCFKEFNKHFHLINRIMKGEKSDQALNSIRKILSKDHWLEKRKGRISYEEIINVINRL